MSNSTVGSLHVTSHVGRDLLQSAGLFKTDKLVVWEYVSNGLQYVDPGVNPLVRVALDSKRKRIAVSDNGRGMDWQGLQNFFVMHGENLDRKEGRSGRGLFGTGKSAAFGIADVLRISTVRSGKLSVVELHRSDIEAMKSGEPIPVRELKRESQTAERNGTTVEIDGIHLRSLDQAGVIRYLERHLAHWSKNATVLVNNHECEFAEPPVSQEWLFEPDDSASSRLGNIRLVVKASMRPLEDDLRGISVFSKGVWYETTLAGAEGREMSQYLFGEVDVPVLDEDRSPIPPFDMSRSMQLNVNNQLVRILYAFIFDSVENPVARTSCLGVRFRWSGYRTSAGQEPRAITGAEVKSLGFLIRRFRSQERSQQASGPARRKVARGSPGEALRLNFEISASTRIAPNTTGILGQS